MFMTFYPSHKRSSCSHKEHYFWQSIASERVLIIRNKSQLFQNSFSTMFYSLVVKEGYKSFQAIKLRNIFYTLLLIVVMTKISTINIHGGGYFNYLRERESIGPALENQETMVELSAVNMISGSDTDKHLEPPVTQTSHHLRRGYWLPDRILTYQRQDH